MSMITEQVKQLRNEADGYKGYRSKRAVRVKHLLREAADTIEQLAAKVRKENKTEEAMALERYKDLCTFFHNDKDVLNNRKEFIDWLERMRWHVKTADELFRENEAYQKAFEDIRAEIKALSIMDYEDMYADFNDCKKAVFEIIDKHDPSKAGKENG